jgi:hypothetical protein
VFVVQTFFQTSFPVGEIISVQNVSRAQHPDDADENPKCVQNDVCGVALSHGAPCQDDGVRCVEEPDEHERTLRPEPTDEAEAENPHEHANHLDGFKAANDECIHAGIFVETGGQSEQMFAFRAASTIQETTTSPADRPGRRQRQGGGAPLWEGQWAEEALKNSLRQAHFLLFFFHGPPYFSCP